ncbi:MAG: DUF3048 domain-containing protein [Anaerolineaceae bacterium]|nr:DUF3048 domain-containing protein [Anaerolineaceae bacterium]
MKHRIAIYIALLTGLLVLAACGQFQPGGGSTQALPTRTIKVLTLTPTPDSTATPAATHTPTVTPTPDYPVEGVGPSNFSEGINPLTGLKVTDTALLKRRPIIIKVQNLPRDDRPQAGLSKADIVYEYYTEVGTTRFAAIFYGQDATKVGPVRSARHFDINVAQMYKAIMVFGGAYEAVFTHLLDLIPMQLVVENNYTCPALCREKSTNRLIADTSALSKFLKQARIDNSPQNLDGMFFQKPAPAGGTPIGTVFVRFSIAIYNRWDYDFATHRYLRNSDTVNADAKSEQYKPLLDSETGQQIGADNLVILQVPYQLLVKDKNGGEVWDAPLYGTGTAFLARDGMLYPLTWKRDRSDQIVSLIGPDGKIFPLRPGVTWFEVVGQNSFTSQEGLVWRITFSTP